MRVFVTGVGLAGPGLNGWQTSLPVLRGVLPYCAVPTIVAASDLLPAAERRRTGVSVRLALAVGSEALSNAGCDVAASVFASSSGDGDNLHEICETLASAERTLSPTRFHNSVHNAPAGYWSIATRSRESSPSLCGHDGSFGAGLLEAAAQVMAGNVPVVLIAHDNPYPEPLLAARPTTGCFGVALVLTKARTGKSTAVLDVEFMPDGSRATGMDEPALETVRAGNPAARSLPLLAALARNSACRLTIDCGVDAHLEIEVAPCA